jgi:hypothetical protein
MLWSCDVLVVLWCCGSAVGGVMVHSGDSGDSACGDDWVLMTHAPDTVQDHLLV